MKKLILLITLVVSPVFAQEEEQEISVELESGGSPAVGGVVNEDRNEAIQIAAMPDGSVWYFYEANRRIIIHCSVNEEGNPRCETVIGN